MPMTERSERIRTEPRKKPPAGRLPKRTACRVLCRQLLTLCAVPRRHPPDLASVTRDFEFNGRSGCLRVWTRIVDGEAGRLSDSALVD